ncbi:MAG: hypothetical protein K0S54_3766, partial [Alphaproteobacteria bacterium]|nr:hypothetical protein [Alphaproteobacteria bacterium]
FSDCPRQRNLNPLGRAQSALIGDDFKALNIPVGRVIASPFCRCMDTARIAFGKVTLADEVRGMKADPKMRTHFTALQQPGANLIIVGHNSASGLIGEESCARPRRWWSSPWARTNTSWWPASGPSNGRNSARKPRTAARRAQP